MSRLWTRRYALGVITSLATAIALVSPAAALATEQGVPVVGDETLAQNASERQSFTPCDSDAVTPQSLVADTEAAAIETAVAEADSVDGGAEATVEGEADSPAGVASTDADVNPSAANDDATVEDQAAPAEGDDASAEGVASTNDAAEETGEKRDEAVEGDAGKTDAAEGTLTNEAPITAAQAEGSSDLEPQAVNTSLNGWVKTLDDKGISFKYYVRGVAQTGWVVTDKNPFNRNVGTQRYWLGSSGEVAINRPIDPSQGIDKGAYWAYATPDAYVVRGKWANGAGLVYIADNNGRLYSSGWVVTSAIDGTAQRYWVDSEAHACVYGYSPDGWDHFTTRDGYVVRGRYTRSNGLVYLANNNGQLERAGWVVTDAYGDGLQRYWVDSETHACVPGYSEDGHAHYTLPKGYVLRGAGKVGGEIRIADNEGRLNDGWVVVDAFGYGLQRYWQENGKAVRNRLIKTGDSAWAYARPEGYVVRGKWVSPSGNVYLAKNNGRLENPGWVVSKSYDKGSWQRYWVDNNTHAARTGFFEVAGSKYFGMPSQGFVARPGLLPVRVNNNGVLSYSKGWLVTEAFGQGLQRYWIEQGGPATSKLISPSDAGYWAYATGLGYVVRGKYRTSGGKTYLANNEGRLENPGWVVSKAYDGGELQRYYIDETTHAARTGLFSIGGDDYYGISSQGYVLRGSSAGYVADNAGRLYPSFEASYENAKGDISLSQNARVIGDKVYIFLPSFADVDNIGLSAKRPTSESVGIQVRPQGKGAFKNATSVDLTAEGMVKDADGAWVFDIIAGSSSAKRSLVIMKSASVKSVFVSSADPSSKGQAYVNASRDHSATADVQVLVVNPDGSVVYNVDAKKGDYSTIKGRGNTTWRGKKRPYQIKLSKKEDLLQTGDKSNKAKKWILLANASDSSLLRTSVAMDYASMMGLGSSEYAPIDFYYDGQYQGSYLLIEKVEVGSGRVNIDDLEEEFEDANDGVDLENLPTAIARNSYGQEFKYVVGAKTPESYSGGYILEVDHTFYAGEPCWFNTYDGAIVVKSPEFCSYDAMLYISEYVTRAINAIRNADNAKPNRSLLDYDSFVRATLVSEFTRDIEYYISSTFLNKNTDGPLVAGPVWDYDAVFGVRTDDACDPRKPGRLVWKTDAPMRGSAYMDAHVRQLWKKEGSKKAKTLLGSLDAKRDTIRASQRMNEKLWGYTSFYNQIDPYPTYQQNYEYLKNWLSAQIKHFDSVM